jgi:hypothetical protein
VFINDIAAGSWCGNPLHIHDAPPTLSEMYQMAGAEKAVKKCTGQIADAKSAVISAPQQRRGNPVCAGLKEI